MCVFSLETGREGGEKSSEEDSLWFNLMHDLSRVNRCFEVVGV